MSLNEEIKGPKDKVDHIHTEREEFAVEGVDWEGLVGDQTPVEGTCRAGDSHKELESAHKSHQRGEKRAPPAGKEEVDEDVSDQVGKDHPEGAESASVFEQQGERIGGHVVEPELKADRGFSAAEIHPNDVLELPKL